MLLQSAFDSLPEFNAFFIGVFLSFLGIALLFMPEALKKLENRKTLRFTVAFFLIIVGLLLGIGGFLSNQSQKNKQEKITEGLKVQITQLINTTKIQATVDDMKTLSSEMRTGFEHVISAIKGKPEPPQTQKTVPAAQVPVPTIENTRLIQKTTISDKAEFPYGLQVIIQSNVVIQPVAFALECDGAIGNFNFFIAGQTVYMNVRKTIMGNIAEIRFGFPALTPESPLVVTLLSKTQIRVVKAYKLNP